MDLLIDSEESGNGSAISTRVDVHSLTEFYSNTVHAGKSHLGVPRRKLGTINNSDDIESAVRMFAKEPGAYFAEVRAGRDVLDSRVIEVKSRAQNIELDSAPTPAPPQDALVPLLQRLERLESERSVSRVRGRGENRVRVRRRFRVTTMRDADLAQQPKLLGVFLQQERARDHEATERERAHDRETSELRLEVERLKLNQTASQAEKSSPDLSGLLSQILFKKVASGDGDITDRLLDRVLGDDGEEKSGSFFGSLEKAIDLVNNHADKIPPVLATLGMLAPSAPLQPPQHAPAPRPVSSAPPPQQNASTTKQAQTDELPNFDREATMVFNNSLADMGAGKPVRESARDFVSLFREFPEESAALKSQLEFSSEVILQVVAIQSPEHVPILQKPGAVEWMDSLKAEIAKRLQPKINVAPAIPDEGEPPARAQTA